ncbi:hypothetical protein GLOTRDRAFT_91486 [Gloeophyllum trabeum ATCC 11539]|uniref:Uncharacterized protein n=1 Tax=Gloeophyllum trabeum (strain ATCC 11539 / FP-39264 / Madison 617) TaxID=670483 RepID=S7QEQ9_GLOTA|nr:uncharacterized protein GLOTRDRAFT_91486 [Gloeophyllum trabeum ATCC 11539]EPQ57917.1 hypothetical protein GLOTRDRAFT_91486 [Gloeophyllum trabeum ATCC 11539]
MASLSTKKQNYRCYCQDCHGKVVSRWEKEKHQREEVLRNNKIAIQNNQGGTSAVQIPGNPTGSLSHLPRYPTPSVPLAEGYLGSPLPIVADAPSASLPQVPTHRPHEIESEQPHDEDIFNMDVDSSSDSDSSSSINQSSIEAGSPADDFPNDHGSVYAPSARSTEDPDRQEDSSDDHASLYAHYPASNIEASPAPTAPGLPTPTGHLNLGRQKSAQPTAPEDKPLAQQRGLRARKVHVRTEVLTLQEQSQLGTRQLGLYDNPDDGSDVQDPLASSRFAAVAFLNIKYHVTFRACSLILWTMRTIFIALGHLAQNDKMPTTLTSVIYNFELEDRFQISPACPVCHELFAPSSGPDSTCPHCDVGIFQPQNRTLFESLTGRSAPRLLPKVAVPISPLSNLLVDFLAEGENESICEQWLDYEPSEAGEYHSMLDGDVPRTVKDNNGKRFFARTSLSQPNELRIGVTLSLDWFNKNTSNYCGSHSIGIVSFCVTNLPPELRYMTSNLLIPVIIPGPSEPTAEQLQKYLKIIVDDLIKLFEEGIMIKTPQYPEGALHRFIFNRIMGTVRLHAPSAMSLMTNSSPRSRSIMARSLATGMAKNQWYAQWIQKKTLRAPTAKEGRELGVVHEFLETSPLWAGRLPVRMGEPAGGALTADEYKFATTVALPMIIPVVWDTFLASAQKDFDKQQKKHRADIAAYDIDIKAWKERHPDYEQEAGPATQRARKGVPPLPTPAGTRTDGHPKKRKLDEADDPMPAPPDTPEKRMHKEEPLLFLRFATAIKILLGRPIDDRAIVRGLTLLRDYLLQYRELYGEKAMKLNHHWVVHLPDQIRDYGAVYNFWLFLVERLNKTLKNYNTNHHGGGELEVTLMRTFQRESRVRALASQLSKDSSLHMAECALGERVMAKPGEDRGTVEAAPVEKSAVADGSHYPADECSYFYSTLAPSPRPWAKGFSGAAGALWKCNHCSA